MKLYSLQQIIGENLLTFLRLNGYTKTSLSKLTGISRPTINQILEGQSPNPNIYEEQLKKITGALKLPLDYFINPPSNKPEIWQLPSTQYSDRSPAAKRSDIAQDLLDNLDELLTVAAFYIKG